MTCSNTTEEFFLNEKVARAQAQRDDALDALREIERIPSSRFTTAWRYETAVKRVARAALEALS